MTDLKRVYATPIEDTALAELNTFDEKWSEKYPKIVKSWKDNWTNFYDLFQISRSDLSPDLYHKCH